MRKWKRSSVIKVIAAVILVITAVCVCLHISGIVVSGKPHVLDNN